MNQWEPVKTLWERGCEFYEGGTFLVYATIDGDQYVIAADYEYGGPFVAMRPDSDDVIEINEKDVSHWMPLPAPPTT
jgi:hypothetical protein